MRQHPFNGCINKNKPKEKIADEKVFGTNWRLIFYFISINTRKTNMCYHKWKLMEHSENKKETTQLRVKTSIW